MCCAEELVKKKIRDASDFEWLKQARFYWRDDRDTVIISICDVDFEYSFEYLGALSRHVVSVFPYLQIVASSTPPAQK
jgi:dynein heavy chain